MLGCAAQAAHTACTARTCWRTVQHTEARDSSPPNSQAWQGRSSAEWQVQQGSQVKGGGWEAKA